MGPLTWRSQPSFSQLSREQECARVCLARPVRGRSSRVKDSSPSLPHLLPGSLLWAGKGDRAGGGWVRRLCLCKSACWCIYGPLCILCDCRAQLSMAPLCLGLSLHICSMSLPALTPLACRLSVCPRLPGGSRWFALPSPSGTPPPAGREHL